MTEFQQKASSMLKSWGFKIPPGCQYYHSNPKYTFGSLITPDIVVCTKYPKLVKATAWLSEDNNINLSLTHNLEKLEQFLRKYIPENDPLVSIIGF